MIVLIPAYQPDDKLVTLIEQINRETAYPTVVVDDGSDPARQPIFERLEGLCTVLHHEINRGKGAAIRTGLRYIQETADPSDGVVTVDADGQHLIKDIVSVSQAWEQEKDALVLGSRRFTGKVPFKSRAGNAITRFVFALSTGVRVFDTQTGLRAFSVERTPMMLNMKGDRYEYEINVLLYATRHRVPIREVTIDTVYLDDNKSSHFNPLRDAWRIYKMILLFVLSSLAALAIDYVLFLALSGATKDVPHSLLISVVVARVISSLCNYFINRKWVFHARDKGSIQRYYLTATGIMLVNYGLMSLVEIIMPRAVGKLLVEAVLYPLSFYIQRRFVFPLQGKEGK